MPSCVCVSVCVCVCVYVCVCARTQYVRVCTIVRTLFCAGQCKANQLILKVEPILVSLGNLLRALALHFNMEVCIPNYGQSK